MAQVVRERARQATPADPDQGEVGEAPVAGAREQGADAAAVADEESTLEELARDESGVWVAFAKGAAVGFVVVAVLVASLALLMGLGWTVALGVAAFTAVWGGPGFGGMMGAVLHHIRSD